jgi:hypothetical protein
MKALYIIPLGLALTTSCDRPTTREHASVHSSGVDTLTDDAGSAQKRKVQNNTPGVIPAFDSLEENYNTLTTDQFSDYVRTAIEQHGLSAISELAKNSVKRSSPQPFRTRSGFQRLRSPNSIFLRIPLNSPWFWMLRHWVGFATGCSHMK